MIRTWFSDGILPMPRVFAYCRVSTSDQNTKNQILEIKAAGFAIEPHRIIEENISGSIAAKKRPGFIKLVDRMENSDVLVVTKLDRLGRNAIDVRATVEMLASSGVRVHCLAFGGVDLTSPAGKMTMQVIAAVAEFERDLLLERTHSGIIRAKSAGKQFGRPPSLSADERLLVMEQLTAGASVAELARSFGTSRQSILRIREKHLATQKTG
jgi:putative DNA-invertase from lambdoid prophage Rac